MSHNRLFEISTEPFESSEDHISEHCLDLSEFPSSYGIDYFMKSESERSYDIEWLSETFPYAEVTKEKGQDVLHIGKKFRETFEKEISEKVEEASKYLSEQVKLGKKNFSMIKFQTNYLMRTTEVLFYLDYIRTDIDLYEWLKYNRKVKKLYIGGIMDFHH
jgi:hypothetical protein